MKRTYIRPVTKVVQVEVENGFAQSFVNERFTGIQQFEFYKEEGEEEPDENSAW